MMIFLQSISDIMRPLFLMVFDILKDGKIVTYRREDHDFLMDIRNGKYLDEELSKKPKPRPKKKPPENRQPPKKRN